MRDMVRIVALFAVAAAVLTGCRRTDVNALDVHGVVRDDRNGEPVSGAVCRLERQVVGSGVWVDAWEEVGTTETGPTGEYTLPFERTNALLYRLTVERAGHAVHTAEWSADVFLEEPLRAHDVALSPLGELVFRCVRDVGGVPSGALFVRPTSDADLLPGCAPAAVEVPTDRVDTAWGCTFRGDRYVPFAYRVGIAPETLDSVWVPAFGSAEAWIAW